MKYLLNCLLILLSGLLLSGCEVIGDIFQAGFFSGIFLVVLIVGLIIFIIARLSRKK